jgi:fermentation-respiration switch protein FrsA (DUF1100 family)
MYDYSGYGKSLGKPSFSVVAEDGKAVYDYLINTMHYQPKPDCSLWRVYRWWRLI